MTKAGNPNKNLVVNILVDSFMDNASVNYIIKQDSKRLQRIRKLMEYSYDICNLFGEVLLTDDKKACALIIFPDKKRTTFKSIIADIKLIAGSTGLSFSNCFKSLDTTTRDV